MAREGDGEGAAPSGWRVLKVSMLVLTFSWYSPICCGGKGTDWHGVSIFSWERNEEGSDGGRGRACRVPTPQANSTTSSPLKTSPRASASVLPCSLVTVCCGRGRHPLHAQPSGLALSPIGERGATRSWSEHAHRAIVRTARVSMFALMSS